VATIAAADELTITGPPFAAGSFLCFGDNRNLAIFDAEEVLALHAAQTRSEADDAALEVRGAV
jgi:hypothetical protein